MRKGRVRQSTHQFGSLGRQQVRTQDAVTSLIRDSQRQAQNRMNNEGRWNYVPVTEDSPFFLEDDRLVFGMNLIGVRTAGAFSLELDRGIKEGKTLVIKDERGTASADNITISVR